MTRIYRRHLERRHAVNAEFLVQQGDFGLAARRLGESTILFPDAAASLAPQVEQLNGLALADDRQLRAAGPGGQLDLSQS